MALIKVADLGISSGVNTPAFEAQLSANQDISDNVYTKVEIDTEVFDTDNCYDNSTNYRFTPTVAGKYFVYASIIADVATVNNLEEIRTHIYKNGSSLRGVVINFSNNDARLASLGVQAVISMNGSSDYLELYARINDTSGNPDISKNSEGTYFGAYRIIGA